jgi:hypothetical protein
MYLLEAMVDHIKRGRVRCTVPSDVSRISYSHGAYCELCIGRLGAWLVRTYECVHLLSFIRDAQLVMVYCSLH